ncbi:U-box domain-containing protein 52-like [Juglans regia]|uniref:RING-type E3 ubiquitin transferase n=2 Tax=Juglans regia TaxID=51240 RepID=A0A6P9EGP2_JUGRE|nr:U-box domain-containing protein 52-like [Juglans regia]
MILSRTSSLVDDDDDNVNSTVIAIDKDKNSHYAVKWAVDNLLGRSTDHCIQLVHVRNQCLHPHDFDQAVSREGRPPNEPELQQLFLPYRGFCARKGIQAKEVILHDIDIPSALIDYIAHHSISNIVVGASHRNAITRKFRDADVPSSLFKSAPASCAIYVISKGKVQSTRPAGRSETSRQRSQKVVRHTAHPDTHDSDDTNRNSVVVGRWRSTGSDIFSLDRSSDSLHTPQSNFGSSSRTSSPTLSIDSYASASSSQRNSDSSEPFGFRPYDMYLDNLESSVALESSNSPGSSQTIKGIEAEKMRLRIELKHTMDTYNSVCKEAVVARQKAGELQQWKKFEEQHKLEEAKLAEEAALVLAEVERHKTKAALEAAKMQQRLVEMETQRRKNTEMQAKQEAEEKKRAMDTLANNNVVYRRYSMTEIEVATDHFNSALKIGEGGYGPVYKGVLDHTIVAIKILRPDLSQGQQQFQREIEVLSCIRHPNMVLLLGACPEYGCLVYEYMDNGSLEDRLFRKDDTPPIPWPTRFKIAAEIATGLRFLQTDPEPIVHRDLKPGNILLDKNYQSKISDVGLARLVPPSAADSVTQYHMTAAAGTFCYIDPEYQQTGELSVKSDIYSLGVVLLQIITARPPIGLAHQVGEAIEQETFSEMLDPTVTDWPIEEALSLANLALKCCEMRKRDRPDLGSVLLPELDRLRDLGSVYLSINNQMIANETRFPNSDPVIGSTVNEEEEHDILELDIQRRSV